MNYTKAILACLACSFGIILWLLSAMFVDAWPDNVREPDPMKIGPYLFNLPPWWDDVEASLPAILDCEDDIAKHVQSTFGADVGTRENWRETLKSWALADAELDSFPVYIAHCYATGNQHREAATIYGKLYELADTQGDDCEWYQCYLAYEAGDSLIRIGAIDEAKIWLTRSSVFADPKLAKDAIQYYSRKSMEMLDEIEATKSSTNPLEDDRSS